MHMRSNIVRLTFAVAIFFSGVSRAAELVIWHDLGENGITWFKDMGEEFAKTHPGVTVRSNNYPTDQWFGRCISAINTDTAPDLIYNNYERVIRVAVQTENIMDLAPVLDSVVDKAFLTPGDLQVARYDGKMIIIPIQRVQMAMGVRKSWLDKVGEDYPATWEDVRRVSAKFLEDDPDGDGVKNTFAMALEAAKPRDLIHILDLFMFGSGLRHTLIDPEGNIVIDEPAHAKVLEEVMKAFTVYGYAAPDTINHSFGEMYQVIEGGKAGMFRVGDWNVKKWDAQAIKGDFVVGPWPSFEAGKKGAVVIGGMRGVAIPENSPNKDLAIEFVKFMLSQSAQQMSLNTIGSAVRSDLDVAGMSERQIFFAKPTDTLNPYDFPESIFSFYPELEAAYHRKLLGAISKPPADWQAFIAETAEEMRELAKKLAAK